MDVDGLGAADGTDCGGAIDPDDGIPAFLCTHRMNVLKGITSGPTQQGNIEVVIFSERNSSNLSGVERAGPGHHEGPGVTPSR